MNPVSYSSSFSSSSADRKVLNRHSTVMVDRDESVKVVGAVPKKYILTDRVHLLTTDQILAEVSLYCFDSHSPFAIKQVQTA